MINYNKKYYWTARKPVQINNMLLAEDWNKFNEIENINSSLSSLDELFDISSYLIDATLSCYPHYLKTINNHTTSYGQGISTIKINDVVYTGTLDLHFLSANTILVNSLNGKSGDLTNILSGIKINDDQLIMTGKDIDLGQFLTDNDTIVSSINNGLKNQQWIISSITINNKQFTNTDSQYFIDIDNSFTTNLYKKIQTFNTATIETTNNSSSIVNLEIFRKATKISGVINVGNNTFENVIEWISIIATNNKYEVIKPNSATLVNNTLTINSPSAGIIFYISEI